MTSLSNNPKESKNMEDKKELKEFLKKILSTKSKKESQTLAHDTMRNEEFFNRLMKAIKKYEEDSEIQSLQEQAKKHILKLNKDT